MNYLIKFLVVFIAQAALLFPTSVFSATTDQQSEVTKKLSELIPSSSNFSFLDGFVVSTVSNADNQIIIKGSVNAKQITITQDPTELSNFALTGEDIQLKDIIPQTSSVTFLNEFAFDRVALTGESIEVDGKINSKVVTVRTSLNLTNLEVTGEDLQLKDVIPQTASVTFLNEFAFDKFSLTDKSVEVDGKISNKAVTVTKVLDSKDFEVVGEDLQLKDIIPQTASAGFLDKFAFDKFSLTDKNVEVDGKISNKVVTVKNALDSKDFEVTGDDLQLKDIVPQTASVKFLNEFAFGKFSLTDKNIEVDGKINSKVVTVNKVLNSNDLNVTGAGLQLNDIIPQASSAKFLDAFAFDKFSLVDKDMEVDGTINKKAVTVKKVLGSKELEITGEDLQLKDIIPQTSSVTFLNEFAFDKFSLTDKDVEVDGKINLKVVTVHKLLNTKNFEVTGEDLQLKDIIPQTASAGFLDKFAFDKFSLTDKNVEVDGKISNKVVTVAKMLDSKDFEVTGADLLLKDIIPQTASAGFLDKFAFDKFSLADENVEVDGKINTKAVTVKHVLKTKNFEVTGADLQLKDIVPAIGSVEFLNEFAFDRFALTGSNIEVDGKINSKAVTVSTILKTKNIEVTAKELTLGDVFSEVNQISSLNALSMDKIAISDQSIEVEVELSGKKIDVIKHKGISSYVAIYFEELAADTFIPSAKGHAVNDISLKNALFIVESNSAPSTLKATDLPGDLPNLVGWGADTELKVSNGLNIAATVDVKKSGELASILKTVGISGNEIFLEGTLAKSTFVALAGKKSSANTLKGADKKSILDGLSLSLTVPVPSLPAVEEYVTVKSPVELTINGTIPDDSLWDQLPATLEKSKPADGLNMTLQFNAALNIEGFNEEMDALIDMSLGQDKSLSMVVISAKPWVKPFGINDLTINNGGFEFQLEKTDGKSDANLGFFGTADIGKHKEISVIADFDEKDKKIALNYFELDGAITLLDFPGGEKIPHAKEFELDEIKITTSGIEAKTTISSKKVDAYLFETKSNNGFTFAIDQKDFQIVELLPFMKKNAILKKFSIPKAALIISEKGLTGTKADMPVIAQDMLADIFGEASVSIKIPAGIGFIADFDPKSMGVIGTGLSSIGVHDDAIIMGEFTGVFGGTPGFKLDLMMEATGNASNLPKKVMSFKDGIVPEFFIQWTAEDLYVGAGLDMEVKAGKDKLELETKLELEFSEKGVGVDVLGEMDGTWHNPFGIKGMSLSNLIMKAGIDDTGTVKIGFAGEDKIGDEDIKLAVELDILLEDALPDGVAFSGEITKLGVPAIIDIAETLIKVPGQLSKIPIPFFEIHNAKIAFATPGATDPQLGLVSEGFAFAGDFYFMSKELGSISGSGGPKSGVTFKGDIADINLGIIEFKENVVDIAINLKPTFIIESNIKLLGMTQDVLLDIEPPHFEFDVTDDLGHFGKADLRVRLDGFDLMKGKFDKNADISVVGEFQSTLVPWMEGEIKNGITELKTSATAKLEQVKKDLNAATARVNKINKTIAALKARDKRAKQRADSKFDAAKKRVSSLKSDYDHAAHEAGHCGSHWTHWACKGYWEVKRGVEWGLYKVAEGVLSAAEKAVNTAIDIDPEIAEQYAQRDIELAALAIAKAAVNVAEDAEKFVLKKLEDVLEDTLKHLPFELDQAIIIGDLKDMIKKDDPMVLDVKFKVFGNPMREYFAIKLKDPEFDAISFALLPAIILDKIVEKAVSDVNKDAGKWLNAHIGAKLAEAENKVRKVVLAEEKKYKKVLDSFASNSAKFKKAYGNLAADKAKIAAMYTVSDMMGNSKQFINRYVAVGHSSLCLGVAPNGIDVIQESCKDVGSERWTTAKLEDGYVQLRSKGLCLKAKNANSRQGQPLMLAQCNKSDTHEMWKVISADGFYDSIVNKYSQKCLHFNNENANPKAAYAVWTSCMGVDSQTFRDIADAERPTWHYVKGFIESKDGTCLSTKSQFASYFHIDWRSWSIKVSNKNSMLSHGHDILTSGKCSKENVQNRFNYVEQVNGDIKLVHGFSGWCVVPKYGNESSLSLAPCDRGKDMLWRNNSVANAFRIHNTSLNKCITLKKTMVNNQVVAGDAKLDSCLNSPDQEIKFGH